FRPASQKVGGGLSVNQVFARGGQRMFIRNFGARTGYFFVHRENESNFVETIRAQLFGRRDLGRDYSLGVTGAPAVNEFVIFPRFEEGWHRVHMRREDD